MGLILIVVIDCVAAGKPLKVKFVVHEVRGANGTITASAGAFPGWGTLLMVDNVVRATEDLTSTILGKSTGIGGITQKAGIQGGILSLTKISFTDNSKFNASSITLTATFATTPPYEIIILGGTGRFRGVKGYGIANPGAVVGPQATTKFELTLKW